MGGGVDLSRPTLDNRNLYLNSTVEPMVGIAVDPLCVCVFFPWFTKVVQVFFGWRKRNQAL